MPSRDYWTRLIGALKPGEDADRFRAEGDAYLVTMDYSLDLTIIEQRLQLLIPGKQIRILRRSQDQVYAPGLA